MVTALVAFSTAGVMAVATIRISGQWDPVFQNKFDGELIDQFTAEETFGAFVEWVPVCPEVEAGFGTPRESMRLVRVENDVRLLTVRTAVDT